jgi:hypothetical protein
VPFTDRDWRRLGCSRQSRAALSLGGPDQHRLDLVSGCVLPVRRGHAGAVRLRSTSLGVFALGHVRELARNTRSWKSDRDHVADEDRIRFLHLPDVDGYLIKVDGKTAGIVDQEDLDDYCPLWEKRETVDTDALLEQIGPYLHQ